MNKKPNAPIADKSNTLDPAAKSAHPVRRLLWFQVKLALDALRDILLSPVSIIATVLDLFTGKQGKNSNFEAVLKLGRESERRINLFNQHETECDHRTIDNVLEQVEDALVSEYQNGNLSAKAKTTLEKKLKLRKQKAAK